MENFLKREKIRLTTDFLLVILVAGGGHIKHNENYWKYHSYKGTNLDYDMLYESVNSDQEEKGGYLLKLNHIINLKNLITNV